MKKHELILVSICLICSFNIFGQTSALLDTNNISATVNSNGLLFQSGTSSPGFQVPKGSGKNTIFSSFL